MDNLDPHLSSATGTQEVMFNVFTGLVNTDTRGEIVPELATHWEISQDQLLYTFFLREDAYFHNGDPVEAKDVKYSLERLQGKVGESERPLSSSLNAVTEIITPDSYTVELHLSQGDASLLSKLITAIIPLGSGPNQSTSPVGAGPFSFVSYNPGVNLKMVKNPLFYQEGLPKLDEVEFRIFDPGSNTAFMALQNGELDICELTLGQLRSLDRSRFEVIETPQNMPQLLALNTEFEPFKDLRVRQAINHGVDKDAIIELMAPGSQKLGTNFSEVMAFYAAPNLENTYPYDPQKARDLLAAAGYSNLSFTVKVPSEYTFHMQTAEIIQIQMQQIGVTMNIEPIAWAQWLTDVYGAFNHQATIIGLSGKLDPDAVLGRFSSTHNNNFTRYSSPEIDSLLLQGRATAIPEERVPIYQEIQKLIAEEVPAVFIMDITLYRGVSNRLTLMPTYPIGFIDMKGVDLR